MQEIITRAAAIEAGLAQYYTGEKCPNGHLAPRYVKNCVCLACNRQRPPVAGAKLSEDGVRYFTGKPCKNGHVAERFVRNNQCTACGREAVRASHRKHREKRLKETREWHKAHPKYTTGWARRNRDRTKAHDHNRRARIVSAGGTFTAEDVALILKAQRSRCAGCREKLSGKYEVDHIIALARGGSNRRENLQILCGPCNRSKGARPMEDFMRLRGALL